MEFEYIKYTSIGPIIFGESRDIIRKKLGLNFKSFTRSQLSVQPEDFYISLGCMIDYDKSNNCNAVQLILPARVTYDGNNLLNMRYNELVALLKSQGGNIEEDDDGCISFDFGMGIYIEEDRVNNPYPKALIFFKEGYYK